MDDLDTLMDMFVYYRQIAEFDDDLVSWDTFRTRIEKHRHDPEVVAMADTIKNGQVDMAFYRKFFKYILSKDRDNG